MKIIYSLTFFILFFSSIKSNAQPPAWSWAKGCMDSNSAGKSVAADPFGNVIVAGVFKGDSIVFDTTTLINHNGSIFLADFFVTKYDSQGIVVWAIAGGGDAYDEVTAISCDKSGNSFIVGNFQSDSIELGSTILHRNGTTNTFLAKLNSAGNVVWVKTPTGPHSASFNNIITDTIGNIFISGQFETNTISFDSIVLNNSGSSDAFFVKYDSSGNALLAQSMGGSGAENSTLIALDPAGNIIVSGQYNSQQMIVGSDTLLSSGFTGSYICKYDSSAHVIWTRGYHENKDVFIESIACDSRGNIITTGFYLSTSLHLGSIFLTNSSSPDDADLFVLKLDKLGNSLWARSATDTWSDFAKSVVIDKNDNVIVAGSYNGNTLNFGNITLTNMGSANFNQALYVTKYDSSGNFQWAKGVSLNVMVGGINPGGLACDQNGDLYVTGEFANANAQFGTSTLSPSSTPNMFLAKLSDLINSVSGPEDIKNLIYYQQTNDLITFTFPCTTSMSDFVLIYNLNGDLVDKIKIESIESDKCHAVWETRNFKSGIYIYQIEVNEIKYADKILIVH